MEDKLNSQEIFDLRIELYESLFSAYKTGKVLLHVLNQKRHTKDTPELRANIKRVERGMKIVNKIITDYKASLN